MSCPSWSYSGDEYKDLGRKHLRPVVGGLVPPLEVLPSCEEARLSRKKWRNSPTIVSLSHTTHRFGSSRRFALLEDVAYPCKLHLKFSAGNMFLKSTPPRRPSSLPLVLVYLFSWARSVIFSASLLILDWLGAWSGVLLKVLRVALQGEREIPDCSSLLLLSY